MKRKKSNMMVIGIILVLFCLMALNMVIQNNRQPSNLGVSEGLLAPMPKSPNAVSSQTDIEEKKVDPIPFHGDLRSTKEHILSVIQEMGNAQVVSQDDQYIHAVFVTPKMKYKDDVEFYLDAEAKVIHFRSASRVGYSDMGQNLLRYMNFVQRYQEK